MPTGTGLAAMAATITAADASADDPDR